MVDSGRGCGRLRAGGTTWSLVDAVLEVGFRGIEVEDFGITAATTESHAGELGICAVCFFGTVSPGPRTAADLTTARYELTPDSGDEFTFELDGRLGSLAPWTETTRMTVEGVDDAHVAVRIAGRFEWYPSGAQTPELVPVEVDLVARIEPRG